MDEYTRMESGGDEEEPTGVDIWVDEYTRLGTIDDGINEE